MTRVSNRNGGKISSYHSKVEQKRTYSTSSTHSTERIVSTIVVWELYIYIYVCGLSHCEALLKSSLPMRLWKGYAKTNNVLFTSADTTEAKVQVPEAVFYESCLLSELFCSC